MTLFTLTVKAEEIPDYLKDGAYRDWETYGELTTVASNFKGEIVSTVP